jgi:hypothetical protein
MRPISGSRESGQMGLHRDRREQYRVHEGIASLRDVPDVL